MTKRCCFATAIIICVGTIVSIGAFFLADRLSYVLEDHYFQEQAEKRVAGLTQELRQRLSLVRNFATQLTKLDFSSAEGLRESQESFNKSAEPIIAHPGIASLDWAPFVRWADRDRFEAEMRVLLSRDQFHIKTLAAHPRRMTLAAQRAVADSAPTSAGDGSVNRRAGQAAHPPATRGAVPLGDRKQPLFPILFAAPRAPEGGTLALHRPMPQSVVRRSELFLATNRRFYPRQGPRAGVFVPVTRTVGEREELYGVVTATFRRKLFGLTPASGDPQPVRVTVRDVTTPARQHTVATESPDRQPPTGKITSMHAAIGGHKLKFDCQRNPNYDFRPAWLSWTAFFSGLAVTGLVACVWTVRENRRLEVRNTKLREEIDERKDMQRFLQTLLEFREQERELVAHEIHDGFVQEVVGAQMFVQAISARIDQQDHSCQRDLTMASQLLSKAIEEGRRMISDLKPSVVDELGLLDAVKQYVAEEEDHFGLSITFRHSTGFKRLPLMIERTLYRIIRESLTNVKRHSGVYEASVSLVRNERSVVLEIKDGGCGFDVSQVEDGRYGVRGIQERARLLHGQATVTSSPKTGTCVKVEIPLDNQGIADVPNLRPNLLTETLRGVASETSSSPS